MSTSYPTTPKRKVLAAAVAAAAAGAAVAVLMGMPHSSPSANGIYWVQHAPTPFVDAGRNKMGAVEFDRLVVNWQKAGLSSDDARIVLDKIDAFAPTVTNDVSFMSARMAASVDVAAQLAAAFPEEASVLRDLAAGDDVTAQKPATWDIQALLDLRAAFDSGAWTTEPTTSYLRNAMDNATTYGVDYAVAKEQAEYALQTTGAKAITIGHAFTQSPERMFAMAWALTSIDEGLRNRNSAPFDSRLGLGHGSVHLNAGTISPHLGAHPSSGYSNFTVRPATVGKDWFERVALGARFSHPDTKALESGLQYAAEDLGERTRNLPGERPTLQDAFVVNAITSGRLSEFMNPAPYAAWLHPDAEPMRRAMTETVNVLETQYLAAETPPQERDIAFLESTAPARIVSLGLEDDEDALAHSPSPP